VSYDHRLLGERISQSLHRNPGFSLGELSRELRVSRRTLQNVVNISTGRTFRDFREDVLVERAKHLLESHPTRTIKELSFDLGYKSPRSFARAIRRACGSSPAELRSRIISHILQAQKRSIFPENRTEMD
jgi:AraC-like DNA-binding protein